MSTPSPKFLVDLIQARMQSHGFHCWTVGYLRKGQGRQAPITSRDQFASIRCQAYRPRRFGSVGKMIDRSSHQQGGYSDRRVMYADGTHLSYEDQDRADILLNS